MRNVKSHHGGKWLRDPTFKERKARGVDYQTPTISVYMSKSFVEECRIFISIPDGVVELRIQTQLTVLPKQKHHAYRVNSSKIENSDTAGLFY